MEIRATECIAREVIHGQADEILGLINPVNDGNLAAWMMTLDRAQRMVGTIQTVCDAISARPIMNPGQQALRSIAAIHGPDYFELASPELDATFDEIEAQAQKDADARQVAEAERISKAHPEVFSIQNFAGDLLGMRQKGA